MNKKEHKAIAKAFSHEIANILGDLEAAIDRHFLKEKKFKGKEYKAMKKVVKSILLQEAPVITKKIGEALVQHSLRVADGKKWDARFKNTNQKCPHCGDDELSFDHQNGGRERCLNCKKFTDEPVTA